MRTGEIEKRVNDTGYGQTDGRSVGKAFRLGICLMPRYRHVNGS